MRTYQIGVIGANGIGPAYFGNIQKRWPFLGLYAVCDLVEERAVRARELYGFQYACTDYREMLKDPRIDIVLNLTRPQQHYAITRDALMNGKHVYTEKPLATQWVQAKELAELARQKGLMLCGAPDTCLGAGIQTCRSFLQSGEMGEVYACSAVMLCRGHEDRFPDPAFFFRQGCGPVFDIGPYYVTALMELMGGIRRLRGDSRKPFPRKTVQCPGPHQGESFPVETPTFVQAQLEFASGVLGSLTLSFDTWFPQRSRIELYGTGGTLLVPDPDTFGGPVRFIGRDSREIPISQENADNSRGLGLADMALALDGGTPPAVGSHRLLAVTEVLCALNALSARDGYVEMENVWP